MNKFNQTGNTIIFLILIGVLVIGVILYSKFNLLTKNNSSLPKTGNSQSNDSGQTTQKQIKTYQSKNLKFSVNFSGDFQIEERFNSVFLNSDNKMIIIERIGTNFSTIDEYLEDLGSKNKFMLKNKQKKQVNGAEAIMVYIGDEKNYFIYVSDSVYSFSTSDKSLYDDLDQIAQSFKYIP